MELQGNRRKETGMQKYSETYSIEVPVKYSRQKAMQYAKEGTGVAVPKSEARQALYMMFLKIGARDEVPQQKDLSIAYLNDFWRLLYFENHICPADIPYDIIMDEFTKALVQGRVERKGNNQAAICQAFNEWIVRQDTRTLLSQKRDQMYPAKKPKQLTKDATPETIGDYSDKELLSKYNSIKPMVGISLVDKMIVEFKKEIANRNLSESP